MYEEAAVMKLTGASYFPHLSFPSFPFSLLSSSSLLLTQTGMPAGWPEKETNVCCMCEKRK
jgi:hypothetical protein